MEIRNTPRERFDQLVGLFGSEWEGYDEAAARFADVPNLDCDPDVPIDVMAHCCGNIDVWEALVCYQSVIRQARGFRLAGEIHRAINCERSADAIYNRLPAWARW